MTDETPGADAFPNTCWSRVLGHAADGRRDPDMASLLVAYWRPVHAYLRMRHGLDVEEASDTTQDFFVQILEGGFVERADRRRGRFRGFIKTSLDHYVVDRHRAARAQKRGGDRKQLSLDVEFDDERAPSLPDPKSRTPEQVLDDVWRRELLSRALEDVRVEFEREAKPVYYAVFADAFLAADPPTHRELAAKHGISVTDVSNYLQNVKRRYRARLRRAVAETVDGDDALDEELAWLFGDDGA